MYFKIKQGVLFMTWTIVFIIPQRGLLISQNLKNAGIFMGQTK